MEKKREKEERANLVNSANGVIIAKQVRRNFECAVKGTDFRNRIVNRFAEIRDHK